MGGAELEDLVALALLDVDDDDSLRTGQPGATDTANADDLKKLADQVQEIDKKRQADRELILKEIEKLIKGGSARVVR